MRPFLVFPLTLILTLLTGCQENHPKKSISPEEEKTHSLEETIHNTDVSTYKIITIDNCEYILFKDIDPNHIQLSFGFMAHKGNCKNPIHIYSKVTD